MKLSLLIILISLNSFAIICPSPSEIKKDETRFIHMKDKQLRACYIMCDDTSADAWEMTYFGIDCDADCKSDNQEAKLKSCLQNCQMTSADGWEMAFCGADCEKKFKKK